jgi:hypothetical protein
VFVGCGLRKTRNLTRHALKVKMSRVVPLDPAILFSRNTSRKMSMAGNSFLASTLDLFHRGHHVMYKDTTNYEALCS